jgi:hypothetical protein
MLTVKATRTEAPMNVYAASVALLWSTALRGAAGAGRPPCPAAAAEAAVDAAACRRGVSWRARLRRRLRE